MLKTILVLLALLAGFLGVGGLFSPVDTAKIAGLITLLIAAVLFAGAAVVDAIDRWGGKLLKRGEPKPEAGPSGEL